MNFGLGSFILESPYSLLASLFLLLGFYKMGKLILNYTPLQKIVSNISIVNYQYISISLLFSMSVFYPLYLLASMNKLIILTFSISILFLGIYHFLIKIISLSKKKLLKISFESKNITNLFFLALIVGYFLLTFGPITDADSLDYHISVPIYLINNGEFPSNLLWFHAAQAGAGEIINIFGLVIGAEQFPALCQFSGILSVVGILLNKKTFSSAVLNKKNVFLCIIFLSIPVLIFLTSSAKPQLIFVGFNSLAFAITFYGDKKNLSDKDIFYKFFIVTFLIALSFEGKFSFILSSALIWLLATYEILRKKKFNYFFYTIFIISLVLIPSAIWKYNIYEGNFINKIYFPFFLNSPEGYEVLYNSIKACAWPCSQYFFILPNSLGRYTESLGIALLFVLFLFFLSQKKSVINLIFITFYIFILFKFGNFSPRFLIEPIIWSLFFIKYSQIDLSSKYFFPLKGLVYIQSIVTIAAIWFGIVFISIGSINSTIKEKVLARSAYGYNLAKWVNSEIQESKKVIYTHRSISLVDSYTIPADFLHYSRHEKYLNMLKLLKPDYLVIQNNLQPHLTNLINCTSGLYKKKEDAFIEASRNPLNKNKSKYSAYIYHFDYKLLPGCYANN